MPGESPRRRILALTIVSAALLAAGPAAPQAANPTALSAEVDRLFRVWDRPDAPGAAVLVVRDGETLHARGYGMANLEHGVPIGTTTVFDIASVSKQFAAFAILLLAREGKISLDDDVRAHVPELPDFGHAIRVRHLLHHTSGLRDWPATLRMAGWDYMDVVSYRQILDMAFHQRELNFPPGSEYAYSNTGYNLLAEIVVRATGRSFRDWTRERIFEPLGMRDTHFHDDWTEVVPRRAESYRRAEDASFRRVTSSLTALGSSSLFTTVDDLAHWVRNLDDPTVGDPALVAALAEPGVLVNGEPIAYAGGQVLGEYRGAATASHGGSWAGYRSTLLRFPEHRFAVVILGNVAQLDPGELGYRIADVYLAGVLAPPTRVAGGAGGGAGPTDSGRAGGDAGFDPSVEDLDGYAGEYRSPELYAGYRLAVEDGALVARHFRTGLTVLRPVEPDVFLSPLFGRVEFLRDGAGAVTAFTATSARVRGLRFERVP